MIIFMINEIISIKLSGMVDGAHNINENHNIKMICLYFINFQTVKKLFFTVNLL